MIFLKRTRVKSAKLREGHLYFVSDDGQVKDLGPCTIEDLRLNAFMSTQAYKLLRGKVSTRAANFGRIREFATRLYNNAKDT